MKRVLIVDDETIVRVTLRSIIRWEQYGMQVVADCNSGFQALAYLREHPVELLITDVKMPEMSGIELLRQLRESNRLPLTLMLSGYNEFDLVREAFRLGAHDYILKADLNAELMDRVLRSLNEKYWGFSESDCREETQENRSHGFSFPQDGIYGTCMLEIDDFHRQTARFGEDLKEMLEKPMLELVNQIPRISRRGKITALQPGHYLFLYEVTNRELYRQDMLSVIRQMQSVWRDYMNLTVSAAIGEISGPEELTTSFSDCETLLELAPLSGKAAVVTCWEHGVLAGKMEEAASRCEKLLSRLYEADENGFELEKQKLFDRLGRMEHKEAVNESLRVIALLARKFREYGEDFFAVFPDEVNYYEKLARLETIRDLELWLNNYFRWELEYLGNRLDSRQNDIILRARRFIADNYANPELTLGTVADYVGLNEKYFTTRFTKATGTTFRDYVTELRLSRAKQLLDTTDLRMYEISERIGYNNTEHFNRMFRKNFQISPSDYRKQKKQAQ